MGVLPQVADGSRDPSELVCELLARRHTWHPVARARRPPPSIEPTRDNAQQRAADVLEAAGAALLASRHLDDTSFEVTFRFMGERFIAVVDWRTLHVYDSGICLSGADELLGLDALPAVIREAIELDELNITRR